MPQQYSDRAGRLTRRDWWRLALPVLAFEFGLLLLGMADFRWEELWLLFAIGAEIWFAPMTLQRATDAGYGSALAKNIIVWPSLLWLFLSVLITAAANPETYDAMGGYLLVAAFIPPIGMAILAFVVASLVFTVMLIIMVFKPSKAASVTK